MTFEVCENGKVRRRVSNKKTARLVADALRGGQDIRIAHGKQRKRKRVTIREI